MKKISILLLFTILLPLQANADRLYTTGFEWQNAADGVEFVDGYNSPSISTSIKNGGNASLRFNGSTIDGDGIAMGQTFTAFGTYYYRFDMYIDALTVNTGFYASMHNIGLDQAIGIFGVENLGSGLDVVVQDDYSGGTVSDTGSVSYDTWHRVEVYATSANGAGADVLTIKIDGVTVVNATNLDFITNADQLIFQTYNFSGATDSVTDVYIDNVALNDTTGSYQNSWPGAGKVVAAVPNAAGLSACTAGTFSSVNEIPQSDSSTGSSDRCELDNNPTTGLFNVTDSSTLGIDSYDTINVVHVMARVREETSGATNWFPRLNSNGSGATSGSTVDSGDTTPRTNPNSTSAFGNNLISYVDPVTGVAWTPTGTNSIDSLQIGAGTTDNNLDTHILSLAAMIEYVDGAAPPPTGPLYYSVGKLILTGGTMTII